MGAKTYNEAKPRRPLFSCVLPTKNRAHLLKTCVPCILDQTFDDLELIVIDNDDTTASGEFLANVDDSRLSVIRTGGFSMPRNWQTALKAGVGKYIIVVEDKMHFRRNALHQIADAITQAEGKIITWKIDQFYSLNDIGPSFIASDGENQTIQSSDILESACRGEWRLLGWAGPRGLNSAIPRTTLESFESKWSTPVSRAICPDYSMAFSLLMTQKEVIHIDSILANVLGNSQSTGGACLIRGPLMKEFLIELGMTEEECSARVPVPYLSPVNAIYNDLFSAATLTKTTCAVDMASYFKNLAEEIFVGEDMGGDLRENRKNLIDTFRQQTTSLQMKTIKYVLEQTVIKARRGYPWRKALVRSYYQLRNLGLCPLFFN